MVGLRVCRGYEWEGVAESSDACGADRGSGG